MDRARIANLESDAYDTSVYASTEGALVWGSVLISMYTVADEISQVQGTDGAGLV